jgi:hypothetical protein
MQPETFWDDFLLDPTVPVTNQKTCKNYPLVDFCKFKGTVSSSFIAREVADRKSEI